MLQKFRKAFFAYPGQPADLADTINAAVELANQQSDRVSIKPWPEMHIFGVGLADRVREEISSAELVLCDITTRNLNVYYEVGYAIGCGKSIAPVLNDSFLNATKEATINGFFDGVGFRTYENSQQLADVCLDFPPHSLLDLYSKPINFQQPLYILDTLKKTDFRNAIVSAVKASGVFFRSFDPVEVPRFSTIPIVSEITASAGIVVPLLAPHIEDATRHNLRAAFIAGLGHGLGRETLILQRNYDLVPMDYRDFVESISNEREVDEKVGEFARTAVISAQSVSQARSRKSKSSLQKLTLGSSSAENEFRSLDTYFVETSEYLRAIRGEARVVAGRKGSGKTAIFFQVRDFYREIRNSTVTDLKPESHQLSLFREELLRISDVGIFDHTLAAFWYFVLLSEILVTIRATSSERQKGMAVRWSLSGS
jgi:hypothetical protein